jgi:hypothetical protein
MADEQLAPTQQSAPQQETPHTPPPSSAWVTFWQSLAALLTTVVETFGWSGTLLICGFLFVIWYATPEQKQRIIDLYVLGEGIGNTWPLLVLSGVFALVSFAQYRWHQKKIGTLEKEIGRLGEEKSKMQEKRLGKKLPHAESKLGKRGK